MKRKIIINNNNKDINQKVNDKILENFKINENS